jgi:hypothetical protein
VYEFERLQRESGMKERQQIQHRKRITEPYIVGKTINEKETGGKNKKHIQTNEII